MAEGEARYNPIGYHVGTVWPFDNSFIAWGLRRYGFKDEAAPRRRGHPRRGRLLRRPAARGVRRLPTGQLTRYPVQYPTACSPQAWSTGAPLLLLRTMLGLEPIGEHLSVDPALPVGIGRLELLDIPGRWGRLDAFGRGRVETGGQESLPLPAGGRNGRQALRSAPHSPRALAGRRSCVLLPVAAEVTQDVAEGVDRAVAAQDHVGDQAGPPGLVERAEPRRRCRRGSTR